MFTNPSSLLTQVGMVLDLIAFFLTIPELLNEKQLLIVQKILREVLFWAGVTLFVFSVLLGIAFLSLLTAVSLLSILLFIAPYSERLISVWLNTIELFLRLSSESGYRHWIWLALFSPQIIALLFSWIALKTMEVVEILARDSELRKILLKIGVFFFIGGWVIQLIATFVS